MKKYIIPLIFIFLCGLLFYLRYKGYIPSDADANFYPLILTALIILWYTFETSEIRKYEHVIAKASEENQKRLRRPVVGYQIYTNPNLKHQTRIKISNLANNPLAARINCNFKLNNEPINYSDAYNGNRYWNLQFRETKEGHFSWLDLHSVNNPTFATEYEANKKGLIDNFIVDVLGGFNFKPPSLTMDIEIYCENDTGEYSYYRPVHYVYDYFGDQWVPILESEKPYWEYDLKPKWIEG